LIDDEAALGQQRRVRKIACEAPETSYGVGRFAHAVGLSLHNRTISRCRRPNIEGGLLFFTVVLADRSSALLVKRIESLRAAYRAVQNT